MGRFQENTDINQTLILTTIIETTSIYWAVNSTKEG